MANRISDGSPVFIAPFAHAVIAPLATSAQLADALGEFNYHGGEDVKRLGSVVLVTDSGAGHALLMATAYENESVWMDLAAVANITPTGAIADVGGPVSDRKPSFGSTNAVLGSLDFPIYQLAEVESADEYINSNTQGGKQLGAAIIIEVSAGVYKLFIAQGSAEVDTWIGLDATVVTPTTLTVEVPPHDKKPLVRSPQVAAVPFPVVANADLADVDNVINAGDGVYNGKEEGSMVVITDGLLYTALGSDADSGWAQLISDDSVPINPV